MKYTLLAALKMIIVHYRKEYNLSEDAFAQHALIGVETVKAIRKAPPNSSYCPGWPIVCAIIVATRQSDVQISALRNLYLQQKTPCRFTNTGALGNDEGAYAASTEPAMASVEIQLPGEKREDTAKPTLFSALAHIASKFK